MATENTTSLNKKPQLDLSFTPEYEVVGAEPTQLTFNIHLAAPEVVEDTTKRSTVSLTAVIDKSGSMAGEKLDLVKRTCDFMLNQLSSNDKMGLVEYDTDVNTLFPLSRCSETFKAQAAMKIKKMHSGTCTNLSGGLFAGVEQQQASQFVDWDKTAETPSTPSAETARASAPESAQMPAEPAGDAEAVPPQPAPLPASKHILLPASQQILHGTEHGPPEAVEEDAVRSVFLFTDGLANRGISSAPELVAALGERLDASPRVVVHTFGFGANHSPALLAELARVGAGTYYFLEKEEAIPAAFADALGGLLSVAAQNVSLEFLPAPGVTVSHVHTGFPTSVNADGARVVAVGDLFSEEGKDLLVQVLLPAAESEAGAASAPQQTLVGKLAVSYLDVQGACLERRELACLVARALELPAGLAPNAAVQVQKARLETAAGMAEARAAADRGELEEAKKVLTACLGKVEGVKSEGGFTEQLCSDLREAMVNMVDREVYHTRGSKLMWAKGRCASQASLVLAVECLRSNAPDLEHASALGRGNVWTRTRTDLEGDAVRAHAEQRSCCLSDDEDEGEAGEEERFSYANGKQKAMRGMAKAFAS